MLMSMFSSVAPVMCIIVVNEGLVLLVGLERVSKSPGKRSIMIPRAYLSQTQGHPHTDCCMGASIGPGNSSMSYLHKLPTTLTSDRIAVGRCSDSAMYSAKLRGMDRSLKAVIPFVGDFQLG